MQIYIYKFPKDSFGFILNALEDAIMDRISYDSYKIEIESIDPGKDLSMREVYGLDPMKLK